MTTTFAYQFFVTFPTYHVSIDYEIAALALEYNREKYDLKYNLPYRITDSGKIIGYLFTIYCNEGNLKDKFLSRCLCMQNVSLVVIEITSLIGRWGISQLCKIVSEPKGDYTQDFFRDLRIYIREKISISNVSFFGEKLIKIYNNEIKLINPEFTCNGDVYKIKSGDIIICINNKNLTFSESSKVYALNSKKMGMIRRYFENRIYKKEMTVEINKYLIKDITNMILSYF